MTVGNSRNRDRVTNQFNFDSAGIMAALRRAAIKAQRRAIETAGSYAIHKDGKIVHVTEVSGLNDDESEKN